MVNGTAGEAIDELSPVDKERLANHMSMVMAVIAVTCEIHLQGYRDAHSMGNIRKLTESHLPIWDKLGIHVPYPIQKFLDSA